MLILSLTLKVLCWIGLVILGLFIFVQTIVRLVKYFIHTPSPPIVPYMINNPLRRKLAPPTRIILTALAFGRG
jgi:membrane-associated phospholipid phosphatase